VLQDDSRKWVEAICSFWKSTVHNTLPVDEQGSPLLQGPDGNTGLSTDNTMSSSCKGSPASSSQLSFEHLSDHFSPPSAIADDEVTAARDHSCCSLLMPPPRSDVSVL
jgi:hypothetical protein